MYNRLGSHLPFFKITTLVTLSTESGLRTAQRIAISPLIVKLSVPRELDVVSQRRGLGQNSRTATHRVVSGVFAAAPVFASPYDKEVDVEKEEEKEQDHHYGPGHYPNHQPVGLFRVGGT